MFFFKPNSSSDPTTSSNFKAEARTVGLAGGGASGGGEEP